MADTPPEKPPIVELPVPALRLRVRTTALREDTQALIESARRSVTRSKDIVAESPATVGALVRHKVQTGMLPDQLQRMTIVGAIPPSPCGACELAAAGTEAFVQVEIPDGRLLAFHRACLEMWIAECQRAHGR